jgi:hypothetical protein
MEPGYILGNYISDSRGGAGAYDLMRRAKGRNSMADDPIANMMQYALNTIAWGERNRVKQAAFELASANEQHDDLFTVDFLKKVRMPESEAKQHYVEAWIDGKNHRVRFAQPQIANIINGAKDDSVYNANWHKTWMSHLTRLFTAWRTAKNPAFMMPNAARDVQRAAQRILIKDGAAISGKFIRLDPVANGVVMNELWGGGTKYLKKTVRGRDIYGEAKDWNIAKMYEEFKMSGAVTGYIQERKMKDVKKNLDIMSEIAAGKRGIHKRIYDKGNGFLNDLADISENSTRFAVYMAYRTSGKTMAEAAREAKEATVNFNRKGEATAMAGTFVGFFGATMESSQNTLSLFKRHPVAFAAIAGVHFVKGYLMYGLARRILQGLADAVDDGDDENRTLAENLINFLKDYTDYKLYTNTFIPTGWKMLQIPMSHEWRLFHAFGVMTAQLQDGSLKKSEFIENAVSMASSAFTPFDLTSPGSFVPTAAQTLADILIFGENFMGVPLQKKMFTVKQEENTKNLYKAMPKTSPFFTGMSRGLARLAGFDPDNPSRHEKDPKGGFKTIPGWADINPTHMEHFASGITGGFGSFTIDLLTTLYGFYEAGEAALTGKESKGLFPYGTKHLPAVNRIAGEPPVAGAHATKRFWEMKRYLDTWYDVEKKNPNKGRDATKGENSEILRKLNTEMNRYYKRDIAPAISGIRERQDKIAKARDGLKNALTVTKKLETESRIKKWEKEIEEYEKKRLRGYRKAVDALDPEFDKTGIDYSR